MPAKGLLPELFPSLGVLHATDPPINTFGQLEKFSDDYTQIPGIGPAHALSIKSAVAAANRDADRAAAPAPAPFAKPAPVSPPPAPVANARFRYDSLLVVPAIATEKDGKWNVTLLSPLDGKKSFQGVRQTSGEPVEPGEFSLTSTPHEVIK